MYSQFYNPYVQPYQISQPQPDMNQYRPQIQQPQMLQPTQMSVSNQDERIWVQGESSAQAYLVAPNSFVRLWDSTRPVFYEKRADASGKPSIVAYEYHSNAQDSNVEGVSNKAENDYSEQIKSLNERLNGLEERMNEYEQAESESYYDDTAVPEVPERVPRKPATGSRKTGARG